MVKSSALNDFLSTEFHSSKFNNLWMGAHRKSKEDKLKWVDGSELSYSNWSPGQPSGVNPSWIGENCVFVNVKTKKWNDENCHAKGAQGNNYFVCEYTSASKTVEIHSHTMRNNEKLSQTIKAHSKAKKKNE